MPARVCDTFNVAFVGRHENKQCVNDYYKNHPTICRHVPNSHRKETFQRNTVFDDFGYQKVSVNGKLG